jgi:ABC-2 type transport system permease protein
MLLAGVLLPLTLAPAWIRVLAHIDPLYYAVEGARAAAGGKLSASAVWLAFAVLVPVTTLVLLWATRVYKKGVA